MYVKMTFGAYPELVIDWCHLR